MTAEREAAIKRIPDECVCRHWQDNDGNREPCGSCAAILDLLAEIDALRGEKIALHAVVQGMRDRWDEQAKRDQDAMGRW